MLWNSFNVTCYISKQFSSHCFFIGKNERKTYTTLIRRMHSLGRGEGRAGLLSDSKYMHWLQDEVGLGSRFEWKLCGGQCSFLRPSEDKSRRVVGRCHRSSPYITMPVCFRSVLWRPATGKNKRKKRRQKGGKIEIEIERERERNQHHHRGQKRYFQRHDTKYIKWHS